MPRMVITHDVVDIERWLKGKDERASALGAIGADVTDHVAADDSLRVAVSATIHDMAALQALIDAPPPEVPRRGAPAHRVRRAVTHLNVRGGTTCPSR
jgi:hypothetical protein